MSDASIENLKTAIDNAINVWDVAAAYPGATPAECQLIASMKCPDVQRRSYYLKCCHLVYVYKKAVKHGRPDQKNKMKELLDFFTELMPLVRELKI